MNAGQKSQKSSEQNRNLVNSIFQDFEAGKPQIEDNSQLDEDPGARDVNGKNVFPDCNWTSPDDENKCDDDSKKTEGPAFVGKYFLIFKSQIFVFDLVLQCQFPPPILIARI